MIQKEPNYIKIKRGNVERIYNQLNFEIRKRDSAKAILKRTSLLNYYERRIEFLKDKLDKARRSLQKSIDQRNRIESEDTNVSYRGLN